MKYYLITGEPSGDQHGSDLMQSIMDIDPGAEFCFIGGDNMESVGGKAVIHIRDLAFMGFTQLLSRVFRIRHTFITCKKSIEEFKPDVVVAVDYGGFNLRLIRWLKRHHYRSVYYITPKVWAWMPSRATKLAKYAGLSLCILPFEERFLRSYGVNAEYVGNPVLEYVKPVRALDPDKIRAELGISGQPVVALLPGSRRQEITGMLPLMARMVDQFKDYQFIVAGHSNFPAGFYQSLAGSGQLPVVYGKTLEILRISSAAIINSGTATLEAALIGTPQVVCYRTSVLSYLIVRSLIRVKYISLVNLILDKPCIRELIQWQCNEGNIARSLQSLLSDLAYRRQMIEGYGEIETRIGDLKAPANAAAAVCRIASGSR